MSPVTWTASRPCDKSLSDCQGRLVLLLRLREHLYMLADIAHEQYGPILGKERGIPHFLDGNWELETILGRVPEFPVSIKRKLDLSVIIWWLHGSSTLPSDSSGPRSRT